MTSTLISFSLAHTLPCHISAYYLHLVHPTPPTHNSQALVAGTSPLVAARAVVVMRQLLQHNPAQHEPTVAAMVRLLEKTRVPEARAAIVWVIGEYRDKIPKLYPDALRVLAKGFKVCEWSVFCACEPSVDYFCTSMCSQNSAFMLHLPVLFP